MKLIACNAWTTPSQPHPPTSSTSPLLLADANAHASNRQALKLIHSKPAALRVVYYKRVFTELSPPDEACTSTLLSLRLQPIATPTGAPLERLTPRTLYMMVSMVAVRRAYCTGGPRAVLMLIVNSFNPVLKMHKNMKQTPSNSRDFKLGILQIHTE